MSQKQSEEQIRELLARYIKGECTEREMVLLEKWYGRLSAENKTISLLSVAEEDRLVQELWKAISIREEGGTSIGDGELPAAEEEEEEEEEPEAGVDGHNRRVFHYAAIWTGTIVMAGAVWMFWGRKSQRVSVQNPSVFIAVSTGYQQVKKVLLPDSSVVWLNSATHLAYHLDFATHREVLLTGEAFFQVARDVEHPFVVRAGEASTRVFGTAFNVSAYPEAGQLRISLKSGKVGVEYGGKDGKILTPGELLIYDKESGHGQVMQQAPGEMDVWTAGRLVFYETPLKEALAQVEARYGVHFVCDRVLKNQTITARFENTALEKVLEHLAFVWDLHFKRSEGVIHVR